MSKAPLHVVAALIFKDDKVLICRRRAGKAQAGFWEFPGGKVENNESKQEALNREIKEELGIEIQVIEFYSKSDYHYPNFDIVLWTFTCNYHSGKIKLIDHDQFIWIEPVRLLNYKLSPADIEVASKLALV